MKEIDPNLPINKIAALVASRDISSKRECSKHHKITSSLPILYDEFGSNKIYLKGKKFGRLTVLGEFPYATENRRKKGKKRIVVKCDCGRYEVRNLVSLLRKDAFESSLTCHECWLTYKLKEKEYWVKTGMNHCQFCGKSFTPEELKIHHKIKCSNQ